MANRSLVAGLSALVTLLACNALAQLSAPSPYTSAETQSLSRVWATIRGARRYEDINWAALGLQGPPGSLEAQALTSRHWGTLRGAERFTDINWQSTAGYSGGAGVLSAPGQAAGEAVASIEAARAGDLIDLGELVPNTAARDRVAIARALYDPALIEDPGFVTAYASRFDCEAAATAAATEAGAASFASAWRERLLEDARSKDIVGATVLASWEVELDSYVAGRSGFPVRPRPVPPNDASEIGDVVVAGLAGLDAVACQRATRNRLQAPLGYPVRVRTFEESLLQVVPASGDEIARIGAQLEQPRFSRQLRIRAPVRIEAAVPQPDGALLLYGRLDAVQLVAATGNRADEVPIHAWNPRAHAESTRPLHPLIAGQVRLHRVRLRPELFDDDDFLWSQAVWLDCERAVTAYRLHETFGDTAYLDRFREQLRREAAQSRTLVGTTIRLGVDFTDPAVQRALIDPMSLYNPALGGLNVGRGTFTDREVVGVRVTGDPADVSCDMAVNRPGALAQANDAALRAGAYPADLELRFEPTQGGEINFLPLDATIARRMIEQGLTFYPSSDVAAAGMLVEEELMDGAGTLVLRGPVVELHLEYFRTNQRDAEIGVFRLSDSGVAPWSRTDLGAGQSLASDADACLAGRNFMFREVRVGTPGFTWPAPRRAAQIRQLGSFTVQSASCSGIEATFFLASSELSMELACSADLQSGRGECGITCGSDTPNRTAQEMCAAGRASLTIFRGQSSVPPPRPN
jgi:hypothetical protein